MTAKDDLITDLKTLFSSFPATSDLAAEGIGDAVDTYHTSAPAAVPNHNDTLSIQGGATNDYYHLTNTQHTDLTDSGNTTLHKHTHNDQDSIQGGSASERYHLTSAQHSLLTGGGIVDVSGTPVNNQVATFTDSNTIQGESGLVYDGSTLNITGDIDITGEILQDSWITVTSFFNSWVDFGSVNYNSVGYMIDKQGFVHLQGLVKSGTIGSHAFVLPVGYRPGKILLISTTSNSLFGQIDIDTVGRVRPLSPSSNVWVSLENICFKAV